MSNVEFGLEIEGMARTTGAPSPTNIWTWSASKASRVTIRTRSRAACSSGSASARALSKKPEILLMTNPSARRRADRERCRKSY